MRWQGRQGSGNIQDRRGMGGPIAVGGGIIAVIALLVNVFLGGDVDVSQLVVPPTEQRQLTPEQQAAEDEMAQFVSVVLKETEDVWNKVFAEAGDRYVEPTLVLFTGTAESACG